MASKVFRVGHLANSFYRIQATKKADALLYNFVIAT